MMTGSQDVSPCQSHVFVPVGTLENDIIIILQYPMQCGNKWTSDINALQHKC